MTCTCYINSIIVPPDTVYLDALQRFSRIVVLHGYGTPASALCGRGQWPVLFRGRADCFVRAPSTTSMPRYRCMFRRDNILRRSMSRQPFVLYAPCCADADLFKEALRERSAALNGPLSRVVIAALEIGVLFHSKIPTLSLGRDMAGSVVDPERPGDFNQVSLPRKVHIWYV